MSNKTGPFKLADVLFGTAPRIDPFGLGVVHARQVRELMSQQLTEDGIRAAAIEWYRGLCSGGETKPTSEGESQILDALNHAFDMQERKS